MILVLVGEVFCEFFFGEKKIWFFGNVLLIEWWFDVGGLCLY